MFVLPTKRRADTSRKCHIQDSGAVSTGTTHIADIQCKGCGMYLGGDKTETDRSRQTAQGLFRATGGGHSFYHSEEVNIMNKIALIILVVILFILLQIEIAGQNPCSAFSVHPSECTSDGANVE